MNNQQVAHQILNNAAFIVLVLNQDQTVGYINETGCKLLGCKKEDLIGVNWIDHYVVHENKQEIKTFFDQIIEEKAEPIEYYENYIRIKDDQIRLISWKSSLIRDKKGKVNGLITFGEDVTDKKVLLKRLLGEDVVDRQYLDMAVENARIVEREEIAYELHDNVSQILTTCKLLMNQELSSGSDSPFVEKTFNLLQQAIDDIRKLSHRLSPITEGYTDFELSLKDYAEKIEYATGLKYNVTVEGAEALNNSSLPMSSSILRIIQEVTHNAIKHAQATTLSLKIFFKENAIELEIKDDGIGFDLKSIKRGMGLRSIQNRVNILKGKLYIDTFPGEGCTLSIYIPV